MLETCDVSDLVGSFWVVRCRSAPEHINQRHRAVIVVALRSGRPRRFCQGALELRQQQRFEPTAKILAIPAQLPSRSAHSTTLPAVCDSSVGKSVRKRLQRQLTPADGTAACFRCWPTGMSAHGHPTMQHEAGYGASLRACGARCRHRPPARRPSGSRTVASAWCASQRGLDEATIAR